MRALYQILKALHNNEDLSSENIVERIKQGFESTIDELHKKDKSISDEKEYELCKKEYDLWQKSGFSLDYEFCGYDTLLFMAAECGYIDIIKILIESDANVNGSKHGSTPLHAAAERNHLEAVRILIQNGANVHTKNIRERTPLHYAAVSGSESIIRLLVQNGADPWMKDKNGETPVYSYVYGRAFFLSPGHGDGCLAQFEKTRNGSLFIRYSIMLLGAALATGLFITSRIKPKLPYIIGAVIIVTAVAFAAAATYKFLKSSNEVERAIHRIDINHSYINELQQGFCDIDFKHVEKVGGVYVTNSNNKSTSNDARIFRETQVKRTLRSPLSPFVPRTVKSKLSYFSQGEDQDESKIYKFDSVQDLQPEEKYSIQNIGHATQLIQIPGFNILTDPVFHDLNGLLYPAKTSSHPSVNELPRIDVIIISHNHRDHVDQSSLQELLSYHQEKNWPQPRVFVPMGDKGLLESFGFSDVEEVEWYTKISVINEAKKIVNFISIPADHRSGRSGIDHHKSLINGWIINPEQEDVIFKFSGDTRSLSDGDQLATDSVLWNEIKSKKVNEEKSDQSIEIPDIICLEPSGPNYTRCDMDITHQSTSYSALLKFIEAENLAKLSGKSSREFLQKIQTVMMHHNKFELGPDRFNEGLFVLKKLLRYLDLNEEDLSQELARQEKKIEQGLDKEKLKQNTSLTSRPIISTLPKPTSLLVHAKDFIIKEIKEAAKKLKGVDKEQIKEYLIENTIFPKIGERLNNEQVVNSRFDVKSVQKYNGSKKGNVK